MAQLKFRIVNFEEGVGCCAGKEKPQEVPSVSATEVQAEPHKASVALMGSGCLGLDPPAGPAPVAVLRPGPGLSLDAGVQAGPLEAGRH